MLKLPIHGIFEFVQQVHDLRLHRNVERRDGLVAHDELGLSMAVVGVPEADCDRGWLTRGLGELLAALATNVLSYLDDEQTLEVCAPRPGVLPEQGLSFELVFHYGKGALIFAKPS